MDARVRVEKINQLNSDIERLKKNLNEFAEYPYVVLSNTRARREDYYNQTDESKRINSMSRLADLPDDIKIKELVESAVKKRLTEKQEEVDKLYKGL